MGETFSEMDVANAYDEPGPYAEPAPESTYEPPVAGAGPGPDFAAAVSEAVEQQLSARIFEPFAAQQAEAEQQQRVADFLGDEWDDGYEGRLAQLQVMEAANELFEQQLAPLRAAIEAQQGQQNGAAEEAAGQEASRVLDAVEQEVGASVDRAAVYIRAEQMTDHVLTELVRQGYEPDQAFGLLRDSGFAQEIIANVAREQAAETRGPRSEKEAVLAYGRDPASGRFTRTGTPFVSGPAFATAGPRDEKDAARQWSARRHAAGN